MKASILFCDRCIGEGKNEVRASLIVWIRTSLGGRQTRLDLCAPHYGIVVGQPQSMNGAAPPLPPLTKKDPGSPFQKRKGGPGLEEVTYNKALAYAVSHPRFTFDELAVHLGDKIPSARIGRALRVALEQKKLERYMMGIYQRPGFTMPEPPDIKGVAAASLKLIKANPGMRGPMVAGMAGVQSAKLWKASLGYMRDQKLIRTKGDKSGMRMFAL